ncbi:hypothetical protein EH5_00944 [Bacillus subtilis]|nr:hypothetical protein EH5_00944 [Bacillus subtilis]
MTAREICGFFAGKHILRNVRILHKKIYKEGSCESGFAIVKSWCKDK